MATGDVTISIAVEGGVTKTATFDSATRVLARAWVEAMDDNIDTDAKWQVSNVNNFATTIINAANKQGMASLSYTPKEFTAAT